MRWQKDEVDLWCAMWASQRRRMLGISQLEPRERIGRLSSTLGSVKEDGEGASQGSITQSFPEVYIGPPPNYPLLVNRAWQRMDQKWREIIEAHYVYSHVQSKQKAGMLRISMSLYWKHLTFGKNFIESYVMCATELPDFKLSLCTQNILANA